LLLHDVGTPLVMTSGNRNSEPIVYRDDEAIERLRDLADYFLVHDRAIHMRCDDSIVRAIDAGSGVQPFPLRRSRGFAPAPLKTGQRFAVPTLACGSHLKNTFCMARDRHVFMSHHIGDLDTYETLLSYKEGIEHFKRLFDFEPRLVACDLHPDYGSTQYAHDLEEQGQLLVAVQHHRAHIASCLVDNDQPATRTVIGVAFDGTGYGTDGAIWGGEFFRGSIESGFERVAHLDYAPLPGGEAAIREPWRAAMAHLATVYTEDELYALPLPVVQESEPSTVRLLCSLVRANSAVPELMPRTSSAGRLFDVVAALLGVPGSRRTTYEGQAAIELELLAHGFTALSYPHSVRAIENGWIVDTREILSCVVDDLLAGCSHGDISSRFHRTVANIVLDTCLRIRGDGGTDTVALSGGTFQNALLVRQLVPLLRGEGFDVLLHRRIPANDGGLSLGQAVLAHTTYRQMNG
jgi:hydrogenase maturation protein HypF